MRSDTSFFSYNVQHIFEYQMKIRNGSFRSCGHLTIFCELASNGNYGMNARNIADSFAPLNQAKVVEIESSMKCFGRVNQVSIQINKSYGEATLTC